MARKFELNSLKETLRHDSQTLNLQDNPPVAAVSIIINPKDRGGSILLIRRTEREGDPWSGQTAFPGGHRMAKDATFLETALRETREEVGIDLEPHDSLGFLAPMYSLTRRVQVVPFVFQLRNAVAVQTNREVSEIFWAPVSALEALNVAKSEVSVAEGKLMVDSYIFRGRVIWGLTYRIINILLNRNSAP